MKSRIHIMDEVLSLKIAAGEVVERPASIVKELVENSIDAGATRIDIGISEGGCRLIRVTDNGIGMNPEDAKLAFTRHATSKVKDEGDLDGITTMGFRGEALPSIASVSKVRLLTRPDDETSGTLVKYEGGECVESRAEGGPVGTSIEVKDLFYNTPARKKFLRTPGTEFGHITDLVKRIALANPEVRFTLNHGKSNLLEVFEGELAGRVRDIFGIDMAKGLIPVEGPELQGLIGGPGKTTTTTKSLYLYVNGRPVKDRSMNKAVLDGYGTLIDRGRFPFVVLNLLMDPRDIDVNVHPAKTEVRFKKSHLVYDIIKTNLRKVLALRGGAKASGAAYGEGKRQVPSPPPPPSSGGYNPPTAPISHPKPHSMGGRKGELRERYLGGASHSAHPRAYEDAPEGTVGMNIDSLTGKEKAGQERLSFEELGGIEDYDLLKMEVIGQLWGEYLVAESIDKRAECIIVDQHGAAERCAYERLKEAFYSDKAVPRQLLMMPEVVETTEEEAEAIRGAVDLLFKAGFDIIEADKSKDESPKGGGSSLNKRFLIKAVPELLSGGECGPLIKGIAEEVSHHGGSALLEEALGSILMTIACHSVIRGPRLLSPDEGKALLRDIAGIDFGAYCPHGRPVIKRFSRREVDGFFGR